MRILYGVEKKEEKKTMTTKTISVKKIKEAKKVVKKELEGKEVYLPTSGSYQVRELSNGTLMIYIKRGQKILVRMQPAIGNPKAIA